MTTRTRTHGSVYSVRISGTQAGDAVVFDGTWAAAMRVSTQRIGGPVFADIALELDEDGHFAADIDTAAAPWVAGTYYYDVRLTPPGGNPIWSEGIKLVLRAKNSPAS